MFISFPLDCGMQTEKLIAESKFKDMPWKSFHTGHIALQDHGEEVRYRNIRVKTPWSDYFSSKNKFLILCDPPFYFIGKTRI
jgi:hypothetical protein